MSYSNIKSYNWTAFAGRILGALSGQKKSYLAYKVFSDGAVNLKPAFRWVTIHINPNSGTGCIVTNSSGETMSLSKNMPSITFNAQNGYLPPGDLTVTAKDEAASFWVNGVY